MSFCVKTITAFSMVVAFFFIITLVPVSSREVSPEPAVLDSEYGVKRVGDLEIGDRVVDISWVWDHKLDYIYGEGEGAGITKPVTWIVTGKDHFHNMEPHVTLLSEDIIGLYIFGFDTDNGGYLNNNQWGLAEYGLRHFLNSSFNEEDDIIDEGFYATFSPSFRKAVLETILPNKAWDTGEDYTSKDYVFVLSRTELGGGSSGTHEIGSVLPYYDLDNPSGPENNEELISRRMAELPGCSVITGGYMENTETHEYEYVGDHYFYWTRSPCSEDSEHVQCVLYDGNFEGAIATGFCTVIISLGMRPALNISSDISVFAVANEYGVYEIINYGDITGNGKVTVSDAIRVLRYIVNLDDFNDREKISADVNEDGLVNITDAVLILRYIVGLINDF